MDNNKNEGGAPSGPWDLPLREYVKTHILIVCVYDIKSGNLIAEERIDYGNFEHRKFLGKITFWATTHKYSVETMSEIDYNEDKKRSVG